MKTKYKNMEVLYYDEEKCLKLLDEMAKLGWILRGIMGSSFVFERQIPRTMNYQIDYNEYSETYRDFVTSNGYTFVDRDKNISIFYKNSLDVPDLQSDETSRYLALKKNYKVYWAVLWIMLGGFILALLLTDPLILVPKLTWGNLILAGSQIGALIAFGLGNIFLVLKGITALLIRQNERMKLDKRNNDRYVWILERLFKIKIIVFRVVMIMVMILGINLVVSNLFNFQFLLYLLIWAGILYLISFIYNKIQDIKNEFNNKVFKIIGLLGVIFISAIDGKVFVQDKTYSSKLQTAPFVESKQQRELFYRQQEIIGSEDSLKEKCVFYEKTYTCLNAWVAREVFDELIVRISVINGSDGEANDNSSNILYPSYQEAIKLYEHYSSNVVEQCYRFNHYVVAIKGNVVFSGKMVKEEMIDQVLTYYFDGRNQ